MRETPLTAIRAARDIECLPDGSEISHGLKHALLVLATYYPYIWPSQTRLSADLKITRANVNKRLKALEDAGLISRLRRGRNRSTLYRLNLETIRACIASDTCTCIDSEPEPVSVATQEDQRREKEGQSSPDEDWLVGL